MLAGLALLAAFAPSAASAQATDWPTKPVTVVVPFAAGGNTDVMARIASQKLADALKQDFVVENRVGAGGAIAATYVAQAAPDGYTLFFAAAPQIAVVPHIQKVNYDPHKDLAPVSVFGTGPFILAISGAIPAKTMQEFVAYAKSRKLNYGSGGTGSIGHLSGALFVARAGTRCRARSVPRRRAGDDCAARRSDRHVFRQRRGASFRTWRAARSASSASPPTSACSSFRTCRRSARLFPNFSLVVLERLPRARARRRERSSTSSPSK